VPGGIAGLLSVWAAWDTEAHGVMFFFFIVAFLVLTGV